MMKKNPVFKPSDMDERIKRALAASKRTHFSFEDWDFENANWALDSVVYKAASPSFKGSGYGTALVKNATTGALSTGRWVGWVRSTTDQILVYFWFRNQHADGGASYANSYLIRVMPTALDLYHYINSAATLDDTNDMTWTWSLATWYKIRVTWWVPIETLTVRVERWTGSAWVTLGGDADVDLLDAGNLWEDNAVNRCGVYYRPEHNLDDVEVWG